MPANPKLAHVAKELAAEFPLTNCCFDPTGKFVFATGQGGAITRWSLDDGKRTTFTAHESWVLDLAVSSDGQTLISAAGDDHLVWWPAAAEKPEPVRKVKAHEGWIRSIALSPDGAFLASGGNDRMVRLWNTADGRKVGEFPGAARDIYCVRFHPGGEWLLGGDLDGKIHQWETKTGKLVRTLDAAPLHSYNDGQQVHYGGVRAMAFSTDAKWLAAGGLHKATNPLGNVQQPLVLRFDWESGRSARNHLTDLTNERVWALHYHSDGFLIGCVGGQKGQLIFWDEAAENPTHVFALPNSARGMAVHSDGIQIATAHADSKLRITKLAAKI